MLTSLSQAQVKWLHHTQASTTGVQLLDGHQFPMVGISCQPNQDHQCIMGRNRYPSHLWISGKKRWGGGGGDQRPVSYPNPNSAKLHDVVHNKN